MKLDTEIDYSTYMQQVSLYLVGERDYTLLKGDTGPLVYPAGHVYIYSALYWLTDGGERIDVAQWAFGVVYLGVLAIVMAVYVKAEVGSLMDSSETHRQVVEDPAQVKLMVDLISMQKLMCLPKLNSRPRRIFFPCSSCQNGYIASLYFGYLTMALP